MAERELAILIRARDLASKTIGGVKKEIGSLGRIGTNAMASLKTGITRVGIAAGVGLVGALAAGARSLGDLQRTVNQTNAVIASTGGKAHVSAAGVRELAQELEGITTVDDKVIQDGENMLLTFTGIGSKVFPRATKAALNLAVAMAKGDVSQVDMKASSIQLGKALQDPIKGITALRKVGVSFTDAQKKQIESLVKAGKVEQAQAIILKELEVEFGKAGEAAGTGFEADMRRVQDAGEDATQALARGFMPVLSRAAKFLSTKLADPAVLKAIDELGQGLADAATGALDFLEGVDWKSIGDGLIIAKNAAGTIVSTFMGLPDWVKTAIVTGWGLNKLTGGALSGVITGLAGGLIKGILGMNAGVVNINAAVVNGAGGVGGAAGGLGGASSAPLLGSLIQKALGAGLVFGGSQGVTAGTSMGGPAGAGVGALGGAGMIAGGALIAGPLGAMVGSLAAVGQTLIDIRQNTSALGAGVRQTADVYLQQNPSLADLQRSLAGVDTGINEIQSNPLNVLVSGDALDQLRATREALTRQITAAHNDADRISHSAEVNGHQTTAATISLRDKIESAKVAGVAASGRVATAAAHAGVVAKAGGIAAATAINKKNLSVTAILKTTLYTTISTRQTSKVTGTVGKYQF